MRLDHEIETASDLTKRINNYVQALQAEKRRLQARNTKLLEAARKPRGSLGQQQNNRKSRYCPLKGVASHKKFICTTSFSSSPWATQQRQTPKDDRTTMKPRQSGSSSSSMDTDGSPPKTRRTKIRQVIETYYRREIIQI